jgi:hypothetical protein
MVPENEWRTAAQAIDTSRVTRWLREPLFHFLLIGFALFIAHGLVAPKAPRTSSNRIELTTDDLNQLQMSWAAHGGHRRRGLPGFSVSTGSGRRSSFARASRSVSTRATRLSSGGSRRRWSFSPKTFQR